MKYFDTMYFITDLSPRACTPGYVTTRMLLGDLQLLYAILERDDRCAIIVQTAYNARMAGVMLVMARPVRFKCAIVTDNVVMWRNMILMNTSLREGVDWAVYGHDTFNTYPIPNNIPGIAIMTPSCSSLANNTLFYRVVVDNAEALIRIPGFMPPHAVHTCYLTNDFRQLAGNNFAGRSFARQCRGRTDPLTRAVIIHM